MADDTNFRSYRQGDPHRRGPAAPTPSGREGGSDPLAELARLIGQTDPFAELGRGGAPGAAPYTPRQGAAEGGMPHHPGHADPATAPYAQNSFGAPPAPQHFNPPPFENQAPIEPRQGGFQPAYDPAIYGSAPPAGGYGPQTGYEGVAHMPQGEEIYDDEFLETPSRRGLRTVMVLVGLALLGTGAAFGYRVLFGSSSSAPPPVIKAESSPSKVAPASKSEASNKLIYDRVGDPAQGEKVVSREEQPVDVKDAARSAPRVVFPGLPDSAGAASPPLGSMPPGPSAAEPKKIRTVTIRPDQPLAEAGAPKGAAQALRNSAPPPAAAPPPVAPSNAPLSLSPQAPNAEAPARPAVAAAPAAPARTASVSAPVEAGSYTVQISSQRSEAEAQASFRALQAKYPDLMTGRQPIIRRADLGDKGIYFRAMVGPFASLDQASQFCSSLKSAGGQCVIQKN